MYPMTMSEPKRLGLIIDIPDYGAQGDIGDIVEITGERDYGYNGPPIMTAIQAQKVVIENTFTYKLKFNLAYIAQTCSKSKILELSESVINSNLVKLLLL